MENTYRHPWGIFPQLAKRAFKPKTKTAIPTKTRMKTLDDLQETVTYYAEQQTPVYLKVSRRMGDGLTCDTYFGTFEAAMEGQIFRFYDIDNGIHRVIPAECLLMIKATELD